MKKDKSSFSRWESIVHNIGKDFEKRASKYDKDGTFVFENYEQLRKFRFFSLLIPKELGGEGVNYSEICDLIRIIAHYCGSTALAFSMHQHLIAALVWKYKHNGNGVLMLRTVAEHQIILVSTGARDWLESNGQMEKTDGGYLFSAKKQFASQSKIGDVAITSAPFLTKNNEWKVLHFSVPLKSNGVKILDDWDVMGMKGTGSNTVTFENVFIPDSVIALERDRHEFHNIWNVVLTVAMPIIMSTYIGIAEKAFKLSVSIGKDYKRNYENLPYIIGKMNNIMLSAKTQWEKMCLLSNELCFDPSEQTTIDILSLKTNISDSCIQLLSEAMEAIGGQSFYRKNVLERLFRDIHAAPFHPLPRWDQYKFTGERLLNRN